MSTTQVSLYKTETWQPKPQQNLVERMPVEEGGKLSINNEIPKLTQDFTWEDLRGLSFVFEEEWF